MSMKKELTMKAVAEIFKLASRINIKPKDIIGVGGDIVKMGKSLFNTKVNPELTKFINKKGEIPTKIVEDIKIQMIDGLKPSVIRGVGDEDFLYLLMPVRVA